MAELLHIPAGNFRVVLAVILPAVLSYTFIERSLRFGLGLGAVVLASAFAAGVDDSLLFQKRSFFGVLRVEDEYEYFQGHKYNFRRLIHGTTMHGKQFLDEDRRDEPLTYYHRSGPVGQVFAAYNTDPKKNYAVIGLGTGTMACYALPGQDVTFYDIDAVVRDISFSEKDPYFTYVQEARKRGAHLNLVLGDARVQLEHELEQERKGGEPAKKYSLMVIDAFSSDAIPMHLITREALQLYLDRMTEDGIVCFHVSNRYLRLEPVLFNLMKDLGLAGMYESDDEENYPGKARSTWVVLARKPEYLARLYTSEGWEKERLDVQEVLWPLMGWPDAGAGPAGMAMAVFAASQESRSVWKALAPGRNWPDTEKVGVWTDDYSNLLSVFMW